MKPSRRTPAIVLVLALALAAPLASTAPVTALGETLAGWSAGLLVDAESKFGPYHRYSSRPLKAGDRGTDVATLQRNLSEVGLETSVNGFYGATTRSNVRRWEDWRGRRPDGRIDQSEARGLRDQARHAGLRDQARHAGPHDRDRELRTGDGRPWPREAMHR